MSDIQWRGPQDGLPPAGMEVEAFCRGVWKNGKIVAVVNDANGEWAIVQFDDDWKVCRGFELRPIQSERDKAIGEMYAAIPENEKASIEWQAHAERIIESLFDAGYRKTC